MLVSGGKLGSVIETVKVIIRKETGEELYADIVRDHDKGTLNINVTGKPDNLKEDRGTHIQIMSCLLEGLGKNS